MAPEQVGISKYLQFALELANLAPNSRILDAPTGYGRHAHWLSQHGYQVVAVDWDAGRIETARRTAPSAKTKIVWKVANLEADYAVIGGSFDAMVCIHYFSQNIVARAHEALRAGGLLILETFGGQGGNWQGLPARGWIADALQGKFELILLDEHPVGPAHENASIKLLAKKLPI